MIATEMRIVFESPWLGLLGLALSLIALRLERRAHSPAGVRRLRAITLATLALALAGPVLAGGGRPTVVLLPFGTDDNVGAAVSPTVGNEIIMRYAPASSTDAVGSGLPSLGQAIAGLTSGLPPGSRLVVRSTPQMVLADQWADATGIDGTWWDAVPTDLVPRHRGSGPLAGARRLAAAGSAMDVQAVGGADGRIGPVLTAVKAPLLAWPGEPWPARLTMRVSTPASLTLAWALDGETVSEQAIAALPGLGHAEFVFAPPLTRVSVEGADGVEFQSHTLRVEARPSASSVPLPAQRDLGLGAFRLASIERTVIVTRPPRLLIVGEGSDAVRLADALDQAGVATVVVGPSNLPTRRTELQRYDAAVLVDQPADVFGFDQLRALKDFVVTDGRGLILVGGRQSFLAGAWEGTELEQLAPVKLEPPDRDEHAVVALLLLVDTSASMGSVEGRAGMRKIDLAREAALLAADPLRTGDRIGVLAYADEAAWLAPFRSVGDYPGDQRALAAGLVSPLDTAGGTSMLAGLQLGLPALAAESAASRHAVLVSDGRDAAPSAASFEAVLGAARASGATLSTIAIGADADVELLARLARLGGGRFHHAAEPGDLPRLALEESKLVRAHSLQRGRVVARVAIAGHPALLGVNVAALPSLEGYVALSRRGGAEVVLETPDGDPLLASWNLGSGRVAAWAGDAGESWAAEWFTQPEGQAFWRRLVHYVARRPVSDGTAVAVAVTGRGSDAIADVQDAWGEPAYGAAVSHEGPSGTVIDWLPVAPGLFAAMLGRPAAASTVRVQFHREPDGATSGGAASETARPSTNDSVLPLALDPPSPAWPAVWPSETTAVLAELARAGNGELLPVDARSSVAAAAGSLALWPYLVALAAGLWVLHVAQLVGRWPPRSIRRALARGNGP